MLATTAKLKRVVSAIGGMASDLLCPPVCVSCEAPIAAADRALCPACRSDLPLILGTPCRRCGGPSVLTQPAMTEPPIPCGRCKDEKPRFDEAIAAGVYEGLLRDLTLMTKQSAHAAVALALGDLIADVGRQRLQSLAPDVIASMPMHWSRRLLRQTNGPELMAERLASRLQVEFAPQLLRRTRRTTHQPDVARSQRAHNVRRSFRLGRGYQLGGATVALVDDILTTGATFNAAAAELKRAGAARVIAVVAAKTP